MIRVKRAYNLLNVHSVMRHIKKWFHDRLMNEMKDDPSIKEDTSFDHNGLGKILWINNCLKTMKLVFMITSCSYFVGLGWLIGCK